MEAYEQEMANDARDRLRRIKVWQDFAELNISVRERDQLQKEHLERLVKLRKQKDYKAWVEEDEIDLEGARLLHEINNYKGEHFFQTAFYD